MFFFFFKSVYSSVVLHSHSIMWHIQILTKIDGLMFIGVKSLICKFRWRAAAAGEMFLSGLVLYVCQDNLRGMREGYNQSKCTTKVHCQHNQKKTPEISGGNLSKSLKAFVSFFHMGWCEQIYFENCDVLLDAFLFGC